MNFQLSYWEKDSFFSGIDVVVLGSGIVGLNAAMNLKLKDPNLKIVVLERGFLPYGASTRNAGFACFGSVSELIADRKQMGDDVFNLVEKRWNGLKKLSSNLGDANIGYENHGGYEVFTDKSEYEQCLDSIPEFNKNLKDIIGIKDVFKPANSLLDKFGFQKVSHMIVNSAEGQIDTGKMMRSLLEKVQSLGVIVINGINIANFEEKNESVELFTDQGFVVSCTRLLVCTNAFVKKLIPELDVVPARAQVLITSPIKDLPWQGTFHHDEGFYYFRNVGSRVLFGGGRNLDFKGEETTEFGLTKQIQGKLDYLLKEMILPNKEFQVQMRWSGIMGIGDQKTSIIKQLSNNIFCAVRCGAMGIAIGSLTGEEAASLMTN